VVNITQREDLRLWLESKPRDWALVIAARAALRVAPMAATAFRLRSGKARRTIVLPIFRGMAAAWVANMWPNVRGEYVGATTAAAENLVLQLHF
jgi:hypothetical protein